MRVSVCVSQPCDRSDLKRCGSVAWQVIIVTYLLTCAHKIRTDTADCVRVSLPPSHLMPVGWGGCAGRGEGEQPVCLF